MLGGGGVVHCKVNAVSRLMLQEVLAHPEPQANAVQPPSYENSGRLSCYG
jgi:hypothetical protein